METDKKQTNTQRFSPRVALEQALQMKVWKDEAFLATLQANPQAVLESDYSDFLPEGSLPSDLRIRIIEEEPNTLILVLRQKPADDVHTLSEEALAEVTGGGLISPVVAREGTQVVKNLRNEWRTPQSNYGNCSYTGTCSPAPSPPPTPRITSSYTNCTACG